MKYIVGIVAGVVLLASGAAAAENCASVAVTAIPSCAQSCFLEGASYVGCDSLDFGCQCGKEAALYAAIEPCVATGCPAASFQAVINGASSGKSRSSFRIRIKHRVRVVVHYGPYQYQSQFHATAILTPN